MWCGVVRVPCSVTLGYFSTCSFYFNLPYGKRSTEPYALTILSSLLLNSGQSGSGKTEGARQVIRQLLALSSAPKKEARVQNQITSAGLIMEAFGHAKTSLNDNASRVGRFTELQFNERGRLVGAKMLDYFLEKKRISRSASTPDERNFHIFYQLLAGATVEEKTHLRLTEGMAFHYLSPASLNRNRTLSGMDDAVEFGKLKNALKVLGFQKRQVAQIFQLLAAVLHLGNLTFMEDSSHTNDACVVRNVDSLIFVADILGVDPNALQNTLTYKTKLIKKELCSVFLDAQGAEAQRDELAQALYSLLFSWMVEFFNVKLCDETPANFIGVVDMFGFQQFTVNGLDQFCVNYSNERLHQFFLNRVFEADQADFELEGISESIPRINFFDNSACLQMLGQENGEEGLIGIMSSQSRHLSRKTDATMLEAFSKQYSRHDSLTVTRNMNVFPSFTVQHYLAPVTYRVEGWLEQNVDNLSSDFVTLFRGGPGVSPSMNPFVQGLFTDKALTTESHPRNNNTIVAAQVHFSIYFVLFNVLWPQKYLKLTYCFYSTFIINSNRSSLSVLLRCVVPRRSTMIPTRKRARFPLLKPHLPPVRWSPWPPRFSLPPRSCAILSRKQPPGSWSA